ncbi:Long-chain-alcohol dehydrogenase 1 (plasmid) [Sulfitobacter sp. DSM 110093]|uniref:iron-containing alcohol dehydrogenase n=1 Tax=Sulfitobacter sp. DSM 110093 TaxID=2883127 RepID=UPI001FABF397|nr:iron-containing alcohol dehydrogenase [Sulfitobacter sp. DSM 110093]UOA34201.1 Long-chain-alcohol dehydrogenase 1 [Sulfitobacter sp. DSM 110093]
METLAPFGFATAGHIRFGRGVAAEAVTAAGRYGRQVLLLRGSSVAWVDDLARALTATGCNVTQVRRSGEPSVEDVRAAVLAGRGADVVLGVGGGAVIDLAKAAAALIPSDCDVMEHLEVVGAGKPLKADPLPMIAIPTTSGTGAEVTKNAVISVPESARKVSLRDDRMLPRLALVDPALTDGAPRGVTLGSGLDALVQVIEPYLSSKANPLSDALCRAAIPQGIAALKRLAAGEDPVARDAMAYISLSGGLALANAGLGAVHGLAGVIGGQFGAPHGVICGRLLGPVLAANSDMLGSSARFSEVQTWLAEGFDLPETGTFNALADLLDEWEVDRLNRWISQDADLSKTAREAATSSSMRANPCDLSQDVLEACIRAAM